VEPQAELAVAERSDLHNTAIHEPKSVNLATVKKRGGEPRLPLSFHREDRTTALAIALQCMDPMAPLGMAECLQY